MYHVAQMDFQGTEPHRVWARMGDAIPSPVETGSGTHGLIGASPPRRGGVGLDMAALPGLTSGEMAKDPPGQKRAE
jgi:hypothetical protein